MDLEDQTFKMLSFKLSPLQVARRGQRLKLTLEDNLGKIWVFKPDYVDRQKPSCLPYIKGVNAVVVYRIYKLFGLQTPRIRFVTLNINGKEISGSIQEFIPITNKLSKDFPEQLSSEALDYLLKSQVLDWLCANHDTHRENFLVLSFGKKDKPKKIVRIDNDSAFFLLGKDQLRYDWLPHQSNMLSNRCYYRLWKSYIDRTIHLTVEENFAFIKFITEFPDSFFIELILPVKIYDFKDISQSEFKELKERYKDFLEFILSRKHNLARDFEKFYKDLSRKRGESFDILKISNYQRIITSISKSLIVDIETLKNERAKLKNTASYPSRIDAIFSLEGFLNLQRIYRGYWENEKRNLPYICKECLREFFYPGDAKKNEYEKKALEIYREEIKKICSGKPPSFKYGDINKVIESVIPENLQP